MALKIKKNTHALRLAKLSWTILEAKLLYYYPEKIKEEYHEKLEISDAEYDALEIEYLTLCRTLGRENTLVHKVYEGFEDVAGDGMIEVDFSRPSVNCVLKKYGV